MADNVTLNAGSGGATIATDDDGTAHHQYVKLEWGADNTQTKVASGANAIPIQDGGNTITVDGTVAATQSGTWTVQPGNTANTTAWLVSEVGRGAVFHAQASIATSATQLGSNACKEVTVKNLSTNSNTVWVGIAAVATNSGYELNPGDSITLQVSNTNLLYAIASTGATTICFIGTN
jgi:hypothetical protein